MSGQHPSCAQRGETVKEYSERWVACATSAGSRAVENWVTRAMLEDFVTTLDQAVVADHTLEEARDAWGTVAEMFDEAATAKDRAMRIIATNPAAGMKHDLDHDVILFHERVDRCRTPDKVKSTSPSRPDRKVFWRP